MPGEDPLALVGEDEQPAVLPVLEPLHQRRPPRVGEVLPLVDDERVVALLLEQVLGDPAHLLGQPPLPVVAVVVLPGRRAPRDAEGVELPDVRRSLAARQQRDPSPR